MAGTIVLRVPRDVHLAILDAAADADLSMNAWITKVLSDRLRRLGRVMPPAAEAAAIAADLEALAVDGADRFLENAEQAAAGIEVVESGPPGSGAEGTLSRPLEADLSQGER
jgi:hypothetical protein